MFPTVMGRSGGFISSNEDLFSITLPVGIQTNEMLLAVVGSDGSATTSIGAASAAGWIKSAQFSGNDGVVSLFVKIASASNALNVSIDNESGAWNTFRIANHRGSTGDIFSSGRFGSEPNYPNPSLSPALGLADYLWIVCSVGGFGGEAPTVAPTGFSELLTRSSGGSTSNVSLGTAEMLHAVATKSPGPWVSPDNDYVTSTIAIPGMAGSAVNNGAILALI